MDIDRYIASNQLTWQRLDELSRRASMRVGRLDDDELDELLRLYQRVSTHLSYVRTHYGEPALVANLSTIVARANQVIYRRRGGGVAALARFFTRTFPAAVWVCRRAIAVSAAALLVPAVAMCLWLLHSDEAMAASASPSERQAYVDDLFEQYYSDRSPLQFFGEVTVNNIWVSFQAFSGAVTAGALTLVVLVINGAGLGQVAAWMIAAGEADRFWGFILPHGLLELSAIAIAGGAAFQLGWAVLAPGERTRADALRDEGLRTVTVVLGLMAVFTLAGIIEGFITGRGLPVGLRVGVGALGWVAAVAYFGVLGRSAALDGETGLLTAPPRTWADQAESAGASSAVTTGRLP